MSGRVEPVGGRSLVVERAFWEEQKYTFLFPQVSKWKSVSQASGQENEQRAQTNKLWRKLAQSAHSGERRWAN